jgi:putative ABC transport system ATP-binding protein
VISVSDLTFRYPQGDFALRIDGLEVAAGERVAVVGPSGSGKTTLLNLIAGIALPAAGRVRTNDVEVSALDDGERRDFRAGSIGLVFQEFELLDYLSVLDNILLPYRISAVLDLDAGVRERARRIASEMGIADKLERLPDQLSQGERQRLAVSRALLTEPPLLLADEPTGNLDPLNKDRVVDLLLAQVEASGATLVTVTHDHDLLDRFDRVVDFKEFYSDVGQQTSDVRRLTPDEEGERRVRS